MMQFGQFCRAKCSAPARYIALGKCLYVSAQDNSLCVDDARPAVGGEDRLPHPSDDDLHEAGIKLYGSASAWFTYLGRVTKITTVKDK
jgi:hypothetical protein